MRRFLMISTLVIALTLVACMGKDGENGKLFLKIRLIDCVSYWDDNPNIPYGFQTDVYYSSSSGNYNFEYRTIQGTKWTGSYSLTRNYGESGGFLYNGADGKDRYYTFTCSDSGVSLTYFEDGKSKTIHPLALDDGTMQISHTDEQFKVYIQAKPVGKVDSLDRTKNGI